MFHLLLLDIDGVMTDGTKLYDANHRCIGKSFCDKDFTAIKRFKAAGIQVAFLTGDTDFNAGMAKTRNIRLFDARTLCENLKKEQALPYIRRFYGVTNKEICYVGDDYYDVGILNEIGYAYVPANSCMDITSLVNCCYRLKTKGGEGVIDEIYSIFKSQLKEQYPDDNL